MAGTAGDLGFLGVSSLCSLAIGVRCNRRLVLGFGTGESNVSCVELREYAAGEMCLIKHKLIAHAHICTYAYIRMSSLHENHLCSSSRTLFSHNHEWKVSYSIYIYNNNFGEPFSTFMIIGGWVTVTVPSFKIPACPSQIASQTHNLTEAHQATRLEKGHCQMPPAYMVCGAPRMYTSYIYWIPQPYTSYPKCLCHSTGGRS